MFKISKHLIDLQCCEIYGIALGCGHSNKCANPLIETVPKILSSLVSATLIITLVHCDSLVSHILSSLQCIKPSYSGGAYQLYPPIVTPDI